VSDIEYVCFKELLYGECIYNSENKNEKYALFKSFRTNIEIIFFLEINHYVVDLYWNDLKVVFNL